MFQKDDYVVAAWAEPASGPGWSNAPVWCLVRSAVDGSHRVECIQPDEQSHEMLVLYRASAAVHDSMTYAVRRYAREVAVPKRSRKAKMGEKL